MAKVIDDNLMVCQDCLFYIANDDLPEDNARANAVVAGVDAIEGYVCVGDSDKDHDFSGRSCECCMTHLAGSRHHCVVLGDDFTPDEVIPT